MTIYLKLQKLFKKVFYHPLLVGSLVMVVGNNIYNVGQFIYHFIAGRLLGKADYGDLAAIISILGVVALIQSSLGMVIVKYIASEKNENKIKGFIAWVNWWIIIVAIVTALILFILSPTLIKFLNIIQPSSMYLLAPLVFFYILATIGRSILQGLMKFNRYMASLLSETVIKIPLTFVFIYLGWATFGAVGALTVGVIVSFIIARLSLLSYLSNVSRQRPKMLLLLSFGSLILVQGLALVSMYSADLILVKHFFSPDLAGIYASLSVLGRIAFFCSAPITQVVFPLVAKRHATGEKHIHILILSLILTILMSSVVVIIFIFFPKIVINALFGQSFTEGAGMLWWFGVFMSLLAVAVLFTQYYLSIGKTKIVWLFVGASILQILLIWFIHPNLLAVIQLSIISVSLLVGSLFIYCLYDSYKCRK